MSWSYEEHTLSFEQVPEETAMAQALATRLVAWHVLSAALTSLAATTQTPQEGALIQILQEILRDDGAFPLRPHSTGLG